MSQHSEATAGAQVLVMSRSRSLRLLLIALAFTAAGIWMILAGQPIIGGVTVGFFGLLGVPAIALQAFRPPTLTLHERGFTVGMTSKQGSFSREWEECGPFQAWGPTSQRTAGVSYSTSRTDKRKLRSANRVIAAGDDEAITPGYGGLSAKALADLMNSYRDAALADGSSPDSG